MILTTHLKCPVPKLKLQAISAIKLCPDWTDVVEVFPSPVKIWNGLDSLSNGRSKRIFFFLIFILIIKLNILLVNTKLLVVQRKLDVFILIIIYWLNTKTMKSLLISAKIHVRQIIEWEKLKHHEYLNVQKKNDIWAMFKQYEQ